MSKILGPEFGATLRDPGFGLRPPLSHEAQWGDPAELMKGGHY